MLVVHETTMMKKTFINAYRIIQKSLIQPPTESRTSFEVKQRCSGLHSVGFWKTPRRRLNKLSGLLLPMSDSPQDKKIKINPI